MSFTYLAIYKPYKMLSQFSEDSGNITLKQLNIDNKHVYPVGRLDKESEGLLLLTDDPKVNNMLLDPRFGHQRTYYVQVEGVPSEESLADLSNGVEIKVDKKLYRTKNASVKVINEPTLPERNPPIRYRKNVPTTWLELILTEGKNRQVRKMTAAIGHGTLRLVRWSVEGLTIEGMHSGEVKELDRVHFYKKTGINGK